MAVVFLHSNRIVTKAEGHHTDRLCRVERSRDGTDSAELGVAPGSAASLGGRRPCSGLSSQASRVLPLSHTLTYKQPAWVDLGLAAGKLSADIS